jgi:ABC-2 type transport system permease protein
MWYRLWRLIVKELQAVVGNRQGRFMLIMPVILQTLLFPFAATLEVKNSTLAVYNQDAGPIAIELVQRLASTAAFTHVLNLHSEQELQAALTEQQALLAVRFAPDFSRQVLAGQPAPVQLIMDGRRSNAGQIASAYASDVMTGYLLARSGRPPTSTLVVRNLYNPNLEYKWFVLPSLVAIITTIGCLMVTALSVAREREEGTFDQLLVSPLTPTYIMAGKAVPGILVAMAQGGAIALVAHWAYGVPFTGSVGLLLVGMVAYGLALAGIGLLISSVVSTQQQAFLGVFAFMVPAVILSGYVSPIENMPTFFQWVAEVNPLTYFIAMLKGIFLKSNAWPDVAARLWPLMLIALTTLTTAWVLFRRQLA